jgi:hypothetical protein
MGFDGKRDRWNGYDPSEYQQVVEEFDKVRKSRAILYNRLDAKTRHMRLLLFSSILHPHERSCSDKSHFFLWIFLVISYNRSSNMRREVCDSIKSPCVQVEKRKLELKAAAVEDEFRQEEETDELRGYTEDVSMPGQKFDAKNRQSIRNLRYGTRMDDVPGILDKSYPISRCIGFCWRLGWEEGLASLSLA